MKVDIKKGCTIGGASIGVVFGGLLEVVDRSTSPITSVLVVGVFAGIGAVCGAAVGAATKWVLS